MFQRLNNHRFWETPRCIIVEMGGCRPAPRGASSACFPTSRTLPVYCFVDCDPYGFTNIYRTLKVGSGNAAHINRFLCVPRARFLGVGKFVGVAMTCSEVSADFHSNFLTSQTFESWQTVRSTVSSEIRIDTDQKNRGFFSKNFQRIGNRTEPAPLALKDPLLLKLQ